MGPALGPQRRSVELLGDLPPDGSDRGRSASLPDSEEAFTEKTSIFFKKTRIYRIPDLKRNTLVYLAISAKLINGSPANSVSAVPVMAWPK
jgi:catabolite regulation protein CreA